MGFLLVETMRIMLNSQQILISDFKDNQKTRILITYPSLII